MAKPERMNKSKLGLPSLGTRASISTNEHTQLHHISCRLEDVPDSSRTLSFIQYVYRMRRPDHQWWHIKSYYMIHMVSCNEYEHMSIAIQCVLSLLHKLPINSNYCLKCITSHLMSIQGRWLHLHKWAAWAQRHWVLSVTESQSANRWCQSCRYSYTFSC